MKKTTGLLFFFLFLTSHFLPGQETFRYSHVPGGKFRIVSQVAEDVFINGIFSHSAEILNRISMEILDEREGRGEIKAAFLTSERAYGYGGTYDWGREYDSHFFRDVRGRYEISPEYYMPVVRDVPVFPEGPVAPGDRWSFPGHEVHDLRDNLGVAGAFRIPMDVSYEYIGPEDHHGRELHRFEISYNLFYRPQLDAAARQNRNAPVRISGYSKQSLLWDNLQGRPELYEEEFDIFFDLLSGNTVEYRGVAQARVIEALGMDREKMAEDIQKVLEEKGIADTDVRVVDEGVTISLRNIQFLPDSAILRDSEKEKLDEIAGILSGYPGRDILVGGHTALAGTAGGRQQLSEERARAVADYLLGTGSRRAEEIIVQGYGAERPVGDNRTPEGQAANRRVEITILEN